MAIQGDVRDGDHLNYAMQKTVRRFGSLDFLFVNAGITQVGFLDTFSAEEISIVLEVNLAGAMKTIQSAIPIMREQEFGRIVTMSSATGRVGVPTFPVYSATKWAMIGLTKSTASLLGSHNITCNTLCPDIVRTPLLVNDYIMGALSPDGNASIEVLEQAARQGHVLPVGFIEPSVYWRCCEVFFVVMPLSISLGKSLMLQQEIA